jgi:quinolinate synthase
MQNEVPYKIIIPAPSKEDNTCACSECAFMKMNTLEKIYKCLLDESPEVLLEQEIITKAQLPIHRMLQI